MARAAIGSVSRPVENEEIGTLAEAFLMEEGATPEGRRGVWWWGGAWWVWTKGRWCVRPQEDLEHQVMLWLRNVWVKDGEAVVKVECGRRKCEDVVWAMRGLVKAPWVEVPVWTDGGVGKPDVKTAIPFEDVVVGCKGGEKTVVKRDETWFGPFVVPCEYEEDAQCPRWKQCQLEWGRGDPQWGRCNQWWFGMVLMAKRGYRKWMLYQGRPGGGKGVNCHVQRALLGQGMTSRDMDVLASDFGLNGLQYVNLVNVPEGVRMQGASAQRYSKVHKQLVGQDPITVNEKHERHQRDVMQHAAVQICSNPIPTMANEQEGVSVKMLVLPFTVSFDEGGREDGLEGRLVREELKGIAAWAVRGALELEREGAEKWPKPERAEEVKRMYTLANNPLDQFLETYFVKDEGGFVSSRRVRALWAEFQQRHPKVEALGNMLFMKLEQESTWKVQKFRKKNGGERGLRGLVERREEQEDL